MIKPPMTTTAFYKIAPSEFITFQWTLSDVLASPTSLTIRATGDNNNIYTIGDNDGTIAGDATELVWNPYEWNQANPTLKLTPGEYRLNIWDDRGPDTPRRPGYMQANNALKFALYTPVPYTALADGWTCMNCNAGTRLSTHPLSIALISTLLIVLLSSFTLLRGARR
ncbi:hypothetical protein BDV98DRAFT_531318 [Pterulicium gracile]|uniref:DUF7137 domain-containing protein n=1 Tax=Pterulicium gracile TaxID=1884261 RepID=A0A5C3QDU3_9AGAR|nr:hypothetical protein BDV98DRAFT_531318 [Pterula gracilis]